MQTSIITLENHLTEAALSYTAEESLLLISAIGVEISNTYATADEALEILAEASPKLAEKRAGCVNVFSYDWTICDLTWGDCEEGFPWSPHSQAAQNCRNDLEVCQAIAIDEYVICSGK